MTSYNIKELIAIKQRADVLEEGQIKWLVKEIVGKNIHDAQIGALLMAIYLQGMTREETVTLTSAMTYSGEVLSWPDEWKHLVVDKHSTGGVGDKISLILAPALAACGLKVPMISGRSLDFTGGTLDKLESIPGYNVNMDSKTMESVLETVGCFIVGQTEQIAPADKILYTLRDVTQTVASQPLICGSIVSKKVAESPTCLVYDVKYGTGSFSKTYNEGVSLAHLLCSTSKAMGIETTCFVTNMSTPLGRTVGNGLEVIESVDILKGGGPADVIELVKAQGGELLYLKGLTLTQDEGKRKIEEVLKNGAALKKFGDMLKAQGVSADIANTICSHNHEELIVLSKNKTNLLALKSGIIAGIDALACGEVSFALGNGRICPSDKVTHDTGLKLLKTVGDTIMEGETWVTVYHKDPIFSQRLQEKLRNCITIETTSNPLKPIIETVIRSRDDNVVVMPC